MYRNVFRNVPELKEIDASALSVSTETRLGEIVYSCFEVHSSSNVMFGRHLTTREFKTRFTLSISVQDIQDPAL
jgi:hypothetical protein